MVTLVELHDQLQVHLTKLECLGKVYFIYFSNSTQIVKLVTEHRLKKCKSLVLLIVMILAHI